MKRRVKRVGELDVAGSQTVEDNFYFKETKGIGRLLIDLVRCEVDFSTDHVKKQKFWNSCSFQGHGWVGNCRSEGLLDGPAFNVFKLWTTDVTWNTGERTGGLIKGGVFESDVNAFVDKVIRIGVS